MLVLRPAARLGKQIDALAFAPDGRSLAAPVRGRGALLWTVFTDGERAELVPNPGGGGEVRLAFAPGGGLFMGSDQLYAVDLATRAGVRVPTDMWHTVGFGVSPDGSRLVVSEFQPDRETTRLTCWPADDFTAHRWQLDVRAHVYLPLLFHPSGNRFLQSESVREPVSRYWRSHRVVRSLATGEVIDTSAPLIDHPERFALSPDGRRLAVVIREYVYIYPAAGKWSAIRAVGNDSKKHFTGVAFHPSGRFLAATSNDATVKLYDTTTWEVARTFTWDIGRMRSIAFSPDGSLAAAGSDTGKVVVWDVDV